MNFRLKLYADGKLDVMKSAPLIPLLNLVMK